MGGDAMIGLSTINCLNGGTGRLAPTVTALGIMSCMFGFYGLLNFIPVAALACHVIDVMSCVLCPVCCAGIMFVLCVCFMCVLLCVVVCVLLLLLLLLLSLLLSLLLLAAPSTFHFPRTIEQHTKKYKFEEGKKTGKLLEFCH